MPADYPPERTGGPRNRRMPGQSQPGDSGANRSGSFGSLRRGAAPNTPPPPSNPARRRPPSPPDRSGAYRSYGAAPGASRPGLARPGQSGARRRPWEDDPFAASAAGLATSAHFEAIQRKRHGFTLFHDGNAGHLWRGEVFSLMGESILSVGVVIWLAFLTSSPLMVLFGVLALGLPWLITIPFTASLERFREPAGPLRWLGRIRTVAALGLVAMHFYTIYPALFGLLALIGLLGRTRQSLRVAATRVCLAPGEFELVTNDLYIGASIAGVLGPLLAGVLFLALSERIILVAVAAAIFFALASNSDGFLDSLPEEQRGFLHVTPATAAPDTATRDDLLRAAFNADEDLPDEGESDEEGEDAGEQAGTALLAALSPEQRELALPEWYQQGPASPIGVIADISAGLGLAGGQTPSATALLALVVMALVSGGLSVLEVFYLTQRLNLPEYYLGIIVAVEAGGGVLGALLAAPMMRRLGGVLTLAGLAITGAGLIVLAAAPIAYIAYIAALVMGLGSGAAAQAAHSLLRAGHNGVGRRAVSAAEGFLTALAASVGALLFTLFCVGYPRAHIGTHLLFPGLPPTLLIFGAGAGMVAAALILFFIPGLRTSKPKKDTPATASPGASGTFASPAVGAGLSGATGATGAVGALWADEPDDDDDLIASRHSRAYRAARDDYDDDGYDDSYDDDGYEDDDRDDNWGGPSRGRGGRPPASPRNSRRDRRGRR